MVRQLNLAFNLLLLQGWHEDLNRTALGWAQSCAWLELLVTFTDAGVTLVGETWSGLIGVCLLVAGCVVLVGAAG
jgi:hypothetical protein